MPLPCLIWSEELGSWLCNSSTNEEQRAWLQMYPSFAVCHPAIYLSCHLPDAVDELEEDRRAIRVCMILISMANSLKQSRITNRSHSGLRGEKVGASPVSPKPVSTAFRRFK